MKKVCRIANPQQPSSSSAVTEKDTDWDKCVVCQQITSEVLKCPASSKRSLDGAGYKNLADNLLAFKKIDCLPSNMFSWLKDDQDIEEILRSHKGKWHDSCRLQYNKTKLQRAAKRKASPAEHEDASSNKYTRRSSAQSSADMEQCLFCGKPAKASESLHHASTFGLDARVRQCALQLQDQSLLAKLSVGDLIALEAKYHVHAVPSFSVQQSQTNKRIR